MNTLEGTDFKVKSQSGLVSLNPNRITPNHNIFFQYFSNNMIVPASYAPIASRQDLNCYSKVNSSYSYNSYGIIFSNYKHNHFLICSRSN